MARLLLALKLLPAVLAGLLYVWFESVRSLPRVKRRKAHAGRRRAT